MMNNLGFLGLAISASLVGGIASAAGCVDDLTADSGATAFLGCLKEMQDQMDALSSAVAIPSGAVVAFDLPDGCPTGWNSYEKKQ